MKYTWKVRMDRCRVEHSVKFIDLVAGINHFLFGLNPVLLPGEYDIEVIIKRRKRPGKRK